VFQMGKALRRGEEAPMTRRFTELGIPVHYRIHGDATVEGGDTLWLDEDTLALGQGFRTNAEGLRQMREALTPLGVEVIPVELPYFYGPSEDEFNVMGTNVLALEPRRCLMLDNATATKDSLEEAGCAVLTYRGVEISLKTEGGPTCLTRPILRD